MVVVPGLASRMAALLPDAVATAHHALGLAAPPSHGRLCVVGAGGVGSHVVELARVLHPHLQIAAVVRSEASARRLAGVGVHTVAGLDGAAARLRAEVGRFDAVIDFSGVAAAPAEAARMLAPGGRLVLGSVVDEALDLGTTVTGITTRELHVMGCYVSTLADLRAVAAMATAGRLDLDAKVTHRVPLAGASRAFALLDERPPGMVRVVLEP
jgi:threonine dehydrogenase-like Zn-dependent dehydrogenase